jgi:uncharacterized protein YbjT (DUF2867 family)
MTRSILVTGATGKQGGAVIDALLSPASDFEILAVTRDTESASAQRLAAKNPAIKLVKGDLDNVPALFEAAKAVSPDIWGVFSVQVPGKIDAQDLAKSVEVRQGVDLIDEAVKSGVKQFVYSSVDRGGEEKSWETPTNIPHFRTKDYIDHYLRDKAGSMGWTILRPVIFFENLAPDFQTKVLVTLLRDKMGSKPMPWIACSDIGFFAAQAFREPETYNHRALSLGGDEFDFDEMNKVFVKVTGHPVPTTFSFLGTVLHWSVEEVRTMVDWFAADGYKTDVAELRRLNPKLMDLETWLREKSKFETV